MKAGFSGFSWVRKSRLLPAWPAPAHLARKRPILPKVVPHPVEAARRAAESAFLDVKRGFLTAFWEILSVLFGGRNRLLEEPIPVMFRDTFLAGSARKCLVLPFEPVSSVRKWPESDLKSGQYTAFLSFIGQENVLLVTF